MKPQNILCRGRNGYFKLDHFSVEIYRDEETVTISFYSKQQCMTPPIYLSGPTSDIESLLETIRFRLTLEMAPKG